MTHPLHDLIGRITTEGGYANKHLIKVYEVNEYNYGQWYYIEDTEYVNQLLIPQLLLLGLPWHTTASTPEVYEAIHEPYSSELILMRHNGTVGNPNGERIGVWQINVMALSAAKKRLGGSK